MTSRPILMIITAFALGAYAVTAIVHKEPIPSGLIGAISPIVGTLSLVTLFYDQWSWAWPLIKLLKKQPDLRGTWRVKIVPEWVDPATKKRIDPIVGYFSIYQTSSTLVIRQYTKESFSITLATVIITAPDGSYAIAAIYDNEPSLTRQRAGSTRHHGGFILRVSEGEAPKLEGHYWTDKPTTGEMDAWRISTKRCDSFEEAQTLE